VSADPLHCWLLTIVAFRRKRPRPHNLLFAQRVTGVAVNRIPDDLASAVIGGLIYVGMLFYAYTAMPEAEEPATETAP
jgi:hypothetical protein